MVANSLISANTGLWKKYIKVFFFMSMIDNIIPVSIALTLVTTSTARDQSRDPWIRPSVYYRLSEWAKHEKQKPAV